MFRLVLGQALRLVVFGVVAGLAAAARGNPAARLAAVSDEALRPASRSPRPRSVLVIVAAVASYLPAAGVGRAITPTDALRAQ